MKVQMKRSEAGKRKKIEKIFGFSIRKQMMIGFCMPILFLILIGIVSYYKAAAGLIENYENSTRNALEMTRNSLDSSFRIVNQKVMELGQETSVRSYALGALGKDGAKKAQSKNDVKNKIGVIETSSDIIKNIHIIPVDGEGVLTTQTLSSSEIDSFIKGLEDSEDDVQK